MHIKQETKRKIVAAYKEMASQLYKDRELFDCCDSNTFRLMFLQVISEHILSKQREALTTAKRITKNKVTRLANKKVEKTLIDYSPQTLSWSGKAQSDFLETL